MLKGKLFKALPALFLAAAIPISSFAQSATIFLGEDYAFSAADAGSGNSTSSTVTDNYFGQEHNVSSNFLSKIDSKLPQKVVQMMPAPGIDKNGNVKPGTTVVNKTLTYKEFMKLLKELGVDKDAYFSEFAQNHNPGKNPGGSGGGGKPGGSGSGVSGIPGNGLPGGFGGEGGFGNPDYNKDLAEQIRDFIKKKNELDIDGLPSPDFILKHAGIDRDSTLQDLYEEYTGLTYEERSEHLIKLFQTIYQIYLKKGYEITGDINEGFIEMEQAEYAEDTLSSDGTFVCTVCGKPYGDRFCCDCGKTIYVPPASKAHIGEFDEEGFLIADEEKDEEYVRFCGSSYPSYYPDLQDSQSHIFGDIAPGKYVCCAYCRRLVHKDALDNWYVLDSNGLWVCGDCYFNTGKPDEYDELAEKGGQWQYGVGACLPGHPGYAISDKEPSAKAFARMKAKPVGSDDKLPPGTKNIFADIPDEDTTPLGKLYHLLKPFNEYTQNLSINPEFWTEEEKKQIIDTVEDFYKDYIEHGGFPEPPEAPKIGENSDEYKNALKELFPDYEKDEDGNPDGKPNNGSDKKNPDGKNPDGKNPGGNGQNGKNPNGNKFNDPENDESDSPIGTVFWDWPTDQSKWTPEMKKLYEEFRKKFGRDEVLQDMIDNGVFENGKTEDEVMKAIDEYIAGHTSIKDDVNITMTTEVTVSKGKEKSGTKQVYSGFRYQILKDGRPVTALTDWNGGTHYFHASSIGSFIIKRYAKVHKVSYKDKTISMNVKWTVDGAKKPLYKKTVTTRGIDYSGVNDKNGKWGKMSDILLDVIEGDFNLADTDGFTTERIL